VDHKTHTELEAYLPVKHLEENIVDYWDRFYRKRNAPARESAFASFVASRFDAIENILDIGCGDGRDSFFFEKTGKKVRGIDASKEAIALCRRHAEATSSTCQFSVAAMDRRRFFSQKDIEHVTGQASGIYARFFIHAIGEEIESLLVSELAQLNHPDLHIFLEFRTIEDEVEIKIEEQHFRRYISPRSLTDKFVSSGLELIYGDIGKGLAPFGVEDPVIARLLFRGR
jgi:predicted TPR repeat methyltransferase